MNEILPQSKLNLGKAQDRDQIEGTHCCSVIYSYSLASLYIVEFYKYMYTYYGHTGGILMCGRYPTGKKYDTLWTVG